MSNAEINKNFDLANAFTSYLLGHPRLRNKIPRKAHIVMAPANNPSLTQKNLAMAYDGLKRSRGRRRYFQAIKHARTWKLVEVKRPRVAPATR